MKNILVLGVIAALLGGGGYWAYTQEDSTLYAVKPLIGPAVQAVYASGTVEPTIMIPIAPRTGARMTQLFADEGREVAKGDVLASLEDQDIQKSAEELAAKLYLAQRELARKEPLRKSGAISQQALDSAATGLEAAQAAFEEAQARLGYLKLTAPEDGRIIRRDGEVGQFIPAGQTVFWMECCAPLRISTEVDEEDIPLVKVGQDVLITADAFPGQTFSGSVQSITPKGDPVSRSYRVRISLNDDTPLMTGMTAETNIMISKKADAMLVPAGAVKDMSVQILKDGKISAQKIETGARTEHAIEILSGLSPEDLVLEKNNPELEESKEADFKIREWSLKK